MEDWADREEARAREAKLWYDVLELISHLFRLERPVILKETSITGGADTVNEALDLGLIHVDTDAQGESIFQLTDKGLLEYWNYSDADYFYSRPTAR